MAESWGAYESVEDILEQGDEFEVILECDFIPIVHTDGRISLRDLQGINLGGIEQLYFEDLEEVIRRLADSSYFNDYGIILDMD